jgi:hypothetical protein
MESLIDSYGMVYHEFLFKVSERRFGASTGRGIKI